MGALLNLALEVAQVIRPLAAVGEDSRQVPLDAARETRIRQAIQMLREKPSRRSAYIAGQECADMVPVTIVIRTSHGLVTGDVAVPRDRWDPALFLRFLQEQDERTVA